MQEFLEYTEGVTCKHVLVQHVSRSLPLGVKSQEEKKENTGKKRPGGVKFSSFREDYEQEGDQEQSF